MLLIAACSILSYFYFDNYHKKDDLVSAYRFKKIQSAIEKPEMVYTKNIGDSWDLTEILSAYLKMHGIDHATEMEKDIKEYDLTSAVILSSEPLTGLTIIDSTSGLDGKKVFIQKPVN